MPDSRPISGCVICMNQVHRIGLALDSLAWCDEIVVVDSGSTDGSAALATGSLLQRSTFARSSFLPEADA